MTKLYKFIPIVILVLFVGLFFFDALFQNHTFISSGMILTDLYLFNYPLKSLLHQSLLTGHGVPLWTDLIGNGYPIFAEGQMGALYPLHLFFFSLPIATITAFNSNLIFHIALTSIFTYLYIYKCIKLDKYASLLGAAVFAYSGYILTHLHQVNIILVISYFPLNLLLIERVLAQTAGNLKEKILSIICISIALYAQLNAGHIEMVYYNLLFAFVYAGLRLFIDPFTRAMIITKSFVVLFGVMLALLISTPQLAATFELVEFSQRETGISYEHSTGTLWPLETLILFINPKAYNVYRDEPGYNPQKIETVNIGALYPYIGILPLLMATLAIGSLFLKKNSSSILYKKWTILFGALVALTYLYAVGRSTQLFSVIWEIVPGLKYFRFPIKAIYVIEFSLAILSSIGLSTVIDFANKKSKTGGRGTSNESTQNKAILQKNTETTDSNRSLDSDKNAVKKPFFGSYSRIAVGIVTVIIVGSTLDLYVNNRTIQPTIPAADWLETPEFAQFIQEQSQIDSTGNAPGFTNWRSYSHGTNNIDYTRIFDFKLQKDLQNILHVDFNMIHNIAINREWAVLFLQRQSELNRFNTQINIEEGYLSLPPDLKKSLDIQAVRYLLSDLPIQNPDIKLIKTKKLSSPVNHVIFMANSADATRIPTNQLYLYENTSYSPRIKLLPQANALIMSPEGKKGLNILQKLLSVEFDPAQQLIIESTERYDSLQSTPVPVDQSAAQYQVVEYSAQKIKINTNVSVDSYLTVSDTYYPGWEATVDGRVQKIEKANYAFRAIKLSAGEHTVTMEFEPTHLAQSITAATIGGLLLCSLLAIYSVLLLRARYLRFKRTNLR